MNGLKAFFNNLNEMDKDLFLQLISEFSRAISQSVKNDIEKRLDEVIKEIDSINKKRESLGDRADMFGKFAKELNEFNKRKNVSLEVVLLKQFFNGEEDKLRRKIAELRPNDLLKEKYELRNKLEEMQNKTSSFAKINHVMNLILRKKEEAIKLENDKE